MDGLLTKFYEILEASVDLTPPVAAIKVLVDLVENSGACTISEMSALMSQSGEVLGSNHKYSIAASAGCTLFSRFATKVFASETDFENAKRKLVLNGNDFVASIDTFRCKIANLGSPFIQDDAVILVHSYSRPVMKLLDYASKQNKRFTVYVTESRPSTNGLKVVNSLLKHGIPAHLVLDSAVGYIIGKIDLVLVGAEGVMETGGIVNHIGTYQIAIVAHELKKPFYVVAESYKFVRKFPLNQYDLGLENIEDSLDYTPPNYITLLFTDKGVLTPSAVSDELIKVYN